MYSGTTLTKFSGRVMGAHQKFDRISRRHLTKLGIPKSSFPGIRRILHFEGKNGPDAIKRKSPARDEPWHYFNPFDKSDKRLPDMIEEHYAKLVYDLKINNHEKAAFEAAWLAHAIVDGLTPAHHYPYEENLKILREGQGLESRDSIINKWLMPGATPAKQIKNNWKMWGPKGLMTAHGTFELGVATLVSTLTFKESIPSAKDIDDFARLGVSKWFTQAAREIAVLDMYHKYLEKGWTPKLAWEVRHKLGPVIVKSITLAWHQAAVDAGKA
jgi:hypothetical protein